MDSVGPVGWRLRGSGCFPADVVMFVFGDFGGNNSNFLLSSSVVSAGLAAVLLLVAAAVSNSVKL